MAIDDDAFSHPRFVCRNCLCVSEVEVLHLIVEPLSRKIPKLPAHRSPRATVPNGAAKLCHFTNVRVFFADINDGNERDNYDPETGEQRQVYCLAVSSKRYALFLRDEYGNPILLQKGINNHEDRWSEHGLGHLRNPLKPDSEDREWIPQAWINIIRRTLGLTVEPLGFEGVPAMGRMPITSPTVLRSLAKLNRGKKYRNRIKPFDFLLSCHVKPFGYPPDVNPKKFHLVAPYVPDPECWVDLPWIDQYSGKQYEVTTEGFHGSRGVARVKTYGEVLREYEFHLGAKSADAKGKPSSKQTVGLLRRRHVRVDRIIYIGKESNRLEEIEAGVIHSPESVYTEYPDPNRDEWQTRILPILKKIPISALMRVSGRSRSSVGWAE